MQVVVRVRPMFDVEESRGEQSAVHIHPDDPRQLQVDLLPYGSSFTRVPISLRWTKMGMHCYCDDEVLIFRFADAHSCLHIPMPPQVTEFVAKGPPVTRGFSFHGCLGPAARQQDVMRMCGITQVPDLGNLQRMVLA